MTQGLLNDRSERMRGALQNKYFPLHSEDACVDLYQKTAFSLITSLIKIWFAFTFCRHWGNGAKEINGFMTLREMKGSFQQSCWAENTSQVCCALCVALFLHNLISYIINATLTLSQACGDMKAEAINSIRAISSFLSIQLLPDLLCLAGEGRGVGALINVSLWAGRAVGLDCVRGSPWTCAWDGPTRKTESRKKKGERRRSNLPTGLKVHFQEASCFQTRLNYVLFIGILFYSMSLWIKCKCNIKLGGGTGDWEYCVSFHQHHAAVIHKPVRSSRLHWLWTLHVPCLIALSFLTMAFKCIVDL